MGPGLVLWPKAGNACAVAHSSTQPNRCIRVIENVCVCVCRGGRGGPEGACSHLHVMTYHEALTTEMVSFHSFSAESYCSNTPLTEVTRLSELGGEAGRSLQPERTK